MDIEDITKLEDLVYQKPSLLNNSTMYYCPGCSHDVVYKLVAEVFEETDMGDQAAGIALVGCSIFIYNYTDTDWQEAAYGRAPAVATAIKRLHLNRLVFIYQNDGDLAVTGTVETIYAANHGEDIVIVPIDNGTYSMTGGQMTLTTLLDMGTVTYPGGRMPELDGYPPVIFKILSELDDTYYATHQSIHTAGAVRKVKKALRKAFENSLVGKNTNIVEFILTCSTDWKMTPAKANEQVSKSMVDKYVLGDIKDAESKGGSDEVVTVKI